MKNLLVILLYVLTITLPTYVMSDVSGEIVFAHPVKPRELWITGLNVGAQTRQLYEHEPETDFRIIDVVAQKGGNYIVFLAKSGNERAGKILYNLYVINKRQTGEKATNITQNRFGLITEGDFDISINGDIVFECTPPPGGTDYVYLIPHTEFNKAEPTATLLTDNGKDPVWFPDGKQIAFVEGFTIATLKVATKKIADFDTVGFNPTISPDGRTLATTFKFWGITLAINTYTLTPLFKERARYIPENRTAFMDFKWSPDGEELVYTSSTARKHYAIPYDHRLHEFGRVKEFLGFKVFGYQVPLFDWTHGGAYPVEPIDRLTTVWGKIKQ